MKRFLKEGRIQLTRVTGSAVRFWADEVAQVSVCPPNRWFRAAKPELELQLVPRKRPAQQLGCNVFGDVVEIFRVLDAALPLEEGLPTEPVQQLAIGYRGEFEDGHRFQTIALDLIKHVSRVKHYSLQRGTYTALVSGLYVLDGTDHDAPKMPWRTFVRLMALAPPVTTSPEGEAR